MKHLALVAAAALVAAVPAQAQDAMALAERLQAELDARAGDAQFRGATIALRLPDGQIITAVAGHADAEAGIEMQANHRLLGGSIGKTFVAATLMALVAEGHVDLDDRVADHLSGQAWFDPLPNAADFTVVQLLNHSSGIPIDYFETEPMREVMRISAEDGIDIVDQGISHTDFLVPLGGQEPLWPAGSGFHYSDANYTIIALLIEHLTGNTLEAEVERRFITPFALTETERQRRQMPRLTAAYMDARFQQVFPGIPEKAGAYERLEYDPAFEWGGGGWVFTATDLANWGHAWFSGEALEDEYTAQMRASLNHGPLEQRGWSYGIGLQFREDEGAGERWFHGGYGPGFISKVEYRPESGMTLAVMFNTIDLAYEAHADALWTVVDEALADD